MSIEEQTTTAEAQAEALPAALSLPKVVATLQVVLATRRQARSQERARAYRARQGV
jgi:hypothetical protein